MSSTESSGAPAEASATTPASFADVSFGSTRGSGLARGKAKRPSAPAAATAATSEYTPTAIEIVTAPREYQNPFAPVEPEPVAAVETPAAQAEAAPAPVIAQPVVATPAPVAAPAAPEVVEQEVEAELNILPPAAQKSTPAQTWESEGFKPTREARSDRPQSDRPRREERSERAPREAAAPFDPSTIPEKFLYVRPGYNYVPTPSNYGGAPRESRAPRNETASAPVQAATTEKSGGFFGWLKSLFSGAPAAATAETHSETPRTGDRPRHRGGRGRNQGGEGQRRSRGGRNRNRGEYRGGGDQGGSSAS